MIHWKKKYISFFKHLILLNLNKIFKKKIRQYLMSFLDT